MILIPNFLASAITCFGDTFAATNSSIAMVLLLLLHGGTT